MITQGTDALLKIEGDVNILLDEFKERHLPLAEYARNKGIRDDLILIFGLKNNTPGDTHYYKVVQDKLEELSKDEYESLYKDVLEYNVGLSGFESYPIDKHIQPMSIIA